MDACLFSLSTFCRAPVTTCDAGSTTGSCSCVGCGECRDVHRLKKEVLRLARERAFLLVRCVFVTKAECNDILTVLHPAHWVLVA